MTSEIETLKTNEFLRRRKLRLQQVREQSRDIAKKIRQRAKVEKLHQAVNLDLNKQKEYLNRQGELVKKLENLYVQGIDNVGASHGSASEILQDKLQDNVDLSKVRGKEAAAELRRKRQEKLDQQKKLLDRKLQAREAANELSREKSAVTSKQTKKTTDVTQSKANGLLKDIPNSDKNIDDTSKEKPLTNDMATQWGFEGLPNEWEPNIPILELPNDDRDNPKETNNNVESKSDKSKRLDLFALSNEMPSSLRGGLKNEDRFSIKPSLTIVSEYLQNRVLRLREPDTTGSSKKNPDDLQSIKQTIQRTRSLKPEGSLFSVCHVLDEQVIPVPSWQAEKDCEFCSHSDSHHYSKKKQFNVTNSQINKIFSSIRPPHQDLLPSPVLRGTSPFRRTSVCRRAPKGSNFDDKSTKSSAPGSALTKKPSVMIYNHSTRDTRDIPYGDERLVIRDRHNEEDAYSQAMRETSLDNDIKDREHQKNMQDMRNKVAMTKQNVEKEYKDTINFLNSLPKDKGNKPVKTAYLDDKRQQMQKESRQHKLQQEYKKIEKDCRKHSCTKNRNKSKSPAKDVEDDYNTNDFQYSWMPVPESDGNLAIHTIPTALEKEKSGNTVKFSKVDSYHEYRSRHKHTPPTKDTAGREKQANKRIEAVIIDKSSSDSTEYSSIASDTSSVENIRLKCKEVKSKNDKDLSDAERIIIYKILDTKNDKKKCRNKAKLVKEIAKSLTSLKKPQNESYVDDSELKELKDHDFKRGDKKAENKISFEQINEGIYQTVNEKGLSYNVMNCYATNVEMWQTTADRKPWWDNITSMYFEDNPREAQNIILTEDEIKHGRPCSCNKKINIDEQRDVGIDLRWESGDTPARKPNTCAGCKCGCAGLGKPKEGNIPLGAQPSAATSTSSFKTATNDKANSALPDNGYIKLIDEVGQEAGKFYIGASGFLKDDGYEVVIQLRKKDGSEKTDEKETAEKSSEKDTTKSSTELLQPITQVEITPKSTEENNNIVVKPVDVKSKGLPTKWLSSNKEPIIDKPLEESIKQKEQTVVNNESNDNDDKPVNTPNILLDKGVDTQSPMLYAIPSHFPKTDPMPKSATSTYTQTSLSSPNHRPIFFHMSSSTSTAYMSPPEMVLPTFLRQDYRLNNKDMYDRIQNLNLQERAEVSEQQAYIEAYEDCQCKRCTLSNKVSLTKTKPNKACCCKKHIRLRGTNTPPNTARSCSSQHAYDDNDNKHRLREHKIKCRKSKIDTPSHTSVKSHTHKYKRVCAANKRSENLGMKVDSSTASSYKNKVMHSVIQKNISKTSLNPVVKEYVKKLLELNKEGLKVVDVADQDCSSVATPSSSIINVPYNVNIDKSLESKISLEQIKTMLKEQILNDYMNKIQNNAKTSVTCTQNKVKKTIKTNRIQRKKPLHKVKSLNISKNIQKTTTETKRSSNNIKLPSPSMVEEFEKLPTASIPGKAKFRSKSSPTPRQIHNVEPTLKVTTTPDILSEREINNYNTKKSRGIDGFFSEKKPSNHFDLTSTENKKKREVFTLPSHRASSTTSPETALKSQIPLSKGEVPMNTATQTNESIDSEINFTKLAEDKLQNMEKIADLTEKCTKRLSNLARVLEEVRKNKSLAYSQISTSDSTSDSDLKLDKNASDIKTNLQLNPTMDQSRSETKSSSSASAADKSEEKLTQPVISSDYIPFLTDIPKPTAFKTSDSSFISLCSKTSDNSNLQTPIVNLENASSKSRGKPPTALSRIHLKHGQENVVPHELSTVLEVDSPMSVKLKNQSSRDAKGDVTDSLNRPTNANRVDERDENPNETVGEPHVSSDMLRRNLDLSKLQARISSTESSDESKVQMMDLKKFNEIMLKPFITFQEHAKKCNLPLEEGSNVEDIPKDAVLDDISSFHSDGSLPDVIAELLKRNLISEPFQFDTASNVNSTTVSSESTLSVLALSNMRKDKKKSSVMFQDKENVGETSDSLSISSNPDLENAFKKLGMRWASSTLKKTKERLALSSSSNTSSSSLSQIKLKSFNNQDIPVLASDSVSTVNVSKRSRKDRSLPDSSKNAEQQTSLTNSMTVKEFLNNELAKKITFTNKSNRNDTEEEFVSLFETKMPEEMKHSSQMMREDQSNDSVPSGSNNRARTSTPVQLFKSMTYHSSSSSYISNGLFSNADDLSSVKVTSNSIKNHSTSEKDDLTVPNFSLKMKKSLSDSKSD